MSLSSWSLQTDKKEQEEMMKRYLLTGLIVLLTGAEASENPFDLRQNLKSIDEAQKTLLSELEKVSAEEEIREKADVQKGDPDTIRIATEETPPTPEKRIEESTGSGEKVFQAPFPQSIAVSEPEKNGTVINADQNAMQITSGNDAVLMEGKKDENVSDADIPEIIIKDVQAQAEENQAATLETKQRSPEKYEAKIPEKQHTEQQQAHAKKRTKIEPAVTQKEEKLPSLTEEKKVSDPFPGTGKERSKEETERLYLEALKEVEGE
ncbi:MAG: hypothetical protein ABXS92_04405 [Sulfurimonas sp.]